MSTDIKQEHVLTPKRVKELAGECPPIAYLTLFLTLLCVMVELHVIMLINRGVISPIQGTAINSVAIFAGSI